MANPVTPGPLSEPTAKALTEALRRLDALRRMRTVPPLALTWNEGQPQIYLAGDVGGGGDDGSFWAALVSKTGSLCPAYEFRRVSKITAGCGWTVDDDGADPEGPLYEANACDLPVNDPVTDDPDQFVVVRARPGDGEFFVFEMAPRWDFIRTTSTEPDAGTGYYPAFVLYFPTGGSDPGDAEEVWGWDLNTSP